MSTVNGLANLGAAASNLGGAAVGLVSDLAQGDIKQGQQLIEDYGKAADKLGEGDLLGAAAEMMDAGSFGNVVARKLTGHGLISNDDVARNLIAGVINAAMLNPIALKDFADAANAMDGAKGKAAGSHTCPRPTDQLRKRGLGGKGYAKPRASSGNEAVERALANIAKLIKELTAKGGVDSKLPRIGDDIRGMAKGGSEVSKLGPGATFEDLVAAFMIDVMKDKQREVKEMMVKLEKMNKDKEKAKKIDKMMAPLKQVAGMVAGMHPAGFGAGIAVDQVTDLAKGAAGAGEVNEDSRQLLFEQLKNNMQKIQQMMQSLSNVLNVMHQGAMNSIRNIK